MVPIQGKNFDILFPEQGSYKGAVDTAIVKRAIADSRVLVSQEKDFGKFQLEPEDVPNGAIWLRPVRISQRKIGDLLAGLCRVLTREFPVNPYDFRNKIIEVFPEQVVIRTSSGTVDNFQIQNLDPGNQ